MNIRVDDLTRTEVIDLIRKHLQGMAQHSPPESVHALGLEALRKPNVTFWSVWDGSLLMGCGALKELTATHGEIKSMRTAKAHLRKGVATMLLEHIISEAKRRGYCRLSLETGSMQYFEPAHRLYCKFGFRTCPPFDGYAEDPNSVFMTKELP